MTTIVFGLFLGMYTSLVFFSALMLYTVFYSLSLSILYTVSITCAFIFTLSLLAIYPISFLVNKMTQEGKEL